MRRRFRENVIHVKKTIKVATISALAAATTYGKVFTIGDFFSNAAAITNSFQMARINKLAVTVVPIVNMASSGATVFPRICSVVDLTDGTAEAFDNLLNYSTHRIHMGDKPFTRVWVPTNNNGVQTTGATNINAGLGRKQWIEMDLTGSSTVLYNGYKISTEPATTTASNWGAQIYATCYMSFKMPNLK